jgi:thioredoxin reductase (NADPH)
VESYPVVIIGGGPAGLSAAMQLSRQGHSHLVLERNRVGGLLWNANLVENYPGFPHGIPGPELVSLFQEQAQRLGVKILNEDARVTGFDREIFRIDTSQRALSAEVLILATGTKARMLPDNLLAPEVKDRVFCEVYPVLNESGKKVIIVGGGDAAFDYALNLARANEIILLTRGDRTNALPLLVERARAHPRITCRLGAEVWSVQEGPNGQLQIEVLSTGNLETLEGDFLVAAIGREPDTSFVSPSIMKDIKQLLEDRRLYLIGDLKNGLFRQTTIAVGDGIRAAMEIGQYLNKE